MNRLKHRLTKLEDKFYHLTKAFQEVIVQSSLSQDESSDLMEQLRDNFQARNQQVYTAYQRFTQKMSLFSSDYSSDELTDEDSGPMPPISDFESTTETSSDDSVILPPSKPSPPKEEEEEEDINEEEDKEEEDQPAIPVNRGTPFKDYRKALEEYERGTYTKVWKKWRSIIDMLVSPIIHEAYPMLKLELIRKVITPLGTGVSNFTEFVANVIKASAEYLKLFSELYDKTPQVRKEITKVQMLFAEFEKLLRNIHLPAEKEKKD